ncbi:MAG: hypothetical protein Q8P13_05025 [bacterium]|nr:hypothetical protein [bacterium]
MKFSNRKTLLLASFFWIFLLIAPPLSSANHSWGNFHWARTANPFTLKTGDNVSLAWDQYLRTTASDWSQSSVLDLAVVAGSTNARRCRPTAGRLEVCSYTYGRNGWLGLAQIWVSGGHITQAVTKLNDTYFKTSTYNSPGWRNLVMCQEVGHTLGLDHQDEDFYNLPLGSCMDYTSEPTPNQHPNQHDYDELETIYSHLDSFTSLKATSQKLPQAQGEKNQNFETRKEWGRELKKNRRVGLYQRDLGQKHKLVTFVVFAAD